MRAHRQQSKTPAHIKQMVYSGCTVMQLTTMRIPKQAPHICMNMYAIPFTTLIWPVTIVARVTAGFRCPPEMFAVI